jgi:hypothetical protein
MKEEEYIVERHVIEKYCISAYSKKDAEVKISERGDPFDVKVIKERLLNVKNK